MPNDEFFRRQLLDDVVPFWLKHGWDRQHGGVFTCLERDGSVVDTDKSVWAQGRCAWMFSTMYNTIEKNSEWLELAASCVRFLQQHCFDERGKMYFQVTNDGKPLRMRRYVYSEAFAAIGFAAYAHATNDDALAQQARELLDRFWEWNTKPGFIPPKTIQTTRPTVGIGPYMIALNTAQCVRATVGHPRANEIIERCIDRIRTLFVRPDLEAVLEVSGPNGEVYDHFDGRMLNPGHAIEAAWFVMCEGEARGDPEMVGLGVRMLDWMWNRGWDQQYGGFLYFVDLYGGSVQEYWHDMKFWWPHAEAMIAVDLARRLTGDAKWRSRFEEVTSWAFKHFGDPEHGEWFGYLHRDGRLSNTLKGSLWKGPFHLPRALYRLGWVHPGIGGEPLTM
ncbi:MAG: N-acylglucosamine 2-epimerase [Armatimonadota bacterium]